MHKTGEILPAGGVGAIRAIGTQVEFEARRGAPAQVGVHAHQGSPSSRSPSAWFICVLRDATSDQEVLVGD